MASANSHGARRWSALLITATSAVAFAGGAAAVAAAENGVDRLIAAVSAYLPADAGTPDIVALRRHCGGDAVCAARRIADAVGDRAALVPVDHPDTDTIRWVTTRPSVRDLGRLPDGTLVVALDGFGRKVVRELRAVAAGIAGAPLVLDLRANRGGDFERMLAVAALFTGPVNDALFIVGGDRRQPRAIPATAPINGLVGLTLVVGRETASSGEILAALLRRHAAAEIVGERTWGKDYLVRAIPVSHDLRLLLPAGRIEVPGERLAGGLRPDRPAPEFLLP